MKTPEFTHTQAIKACRKNLQLMDAIETKCPYQLPEYGEARKILNDMIKWLKKLKDKGCK